MREITDATMLRAMAHPLRLKLMNDLVIHGPATATELAERHRESAANCSWHLRHLAKFGFIEEAADLPTKGRNRPWRWVPMGNRWGEGESSPELARAGSELMTQLMGHEFAERQAWEERKDDEPKVWKEAAFAVQSLTWLTAEELAEISDKTRDMALSHHDRASDPATRPEGARPIRFIAWGNPAS
jgi:hypothetical protein